MAIEENNVESESSLVEVIEIPPAAKESAKNAEKIMNAQ